MIANYCFEPTGRRSDRSDNKSSREDREVKDINLNYVDIILTTQIKAPIWM